MDEQRRERNGRGGEGRRRGETNGGTARPALRPPTHERPVAGLRISDVRVRELTPSATPGGGGTRKRIQKKKLASKKLQQPRCNG